MRMRSGRTRRETGVVVLSVLLVIAYSRVALAQDRLVLQRLEIVSYGALDSGGNTDRPSIAVRSDGLVRIAITDFEGGCCPLVAPLKVATRLGDDQWTYLIVTNYGDHPVPHFVPTGELGVLYMDYSGSTLRFAQVGETAATIEDVQQVPGNPAGFVHFAPWDVRSDGEIQAVVLFFDLRLRRTSSGWTSAVSPGTPQDILLGPGQTVLILGAQGLYSFPNGDLSQAGSLVLVPGGVPCCGNLVLDSSGEPNISYVSNGSLIYGVLTKHGWKLETVSSNIGGMLNDSALLVDTKGRPYVIYQNASNHVVIAAKKGSKWHESIDLGQGISGNMVFGPSDEIDATFTSTTDGLVRYARILISH